MSKKSHILEEPLSDDEIDSGEKQTYIPNPGDTNLEADESAYTFLEHISLEWPSQSITNNGKVLYLATNPDSEHKAGRSGPSIIEIDLENTSSRGISYRTEKTKRFINRIRYDNGSIYAITDDHIVLFGEDLIEKKAVGMEAGYGLCVTEKNVFAGSKDGRVLVFDKGLNLILSFKPHESSVESIAVANNMIVSGSSDHSVAFSDMEGNLIRRISNSSDINCLDIRQEKLVFGDDEGNITFYDMRSDECEKISWHKTPVSMVRWKDDEIFISGSDEQVCIWDTSLCDSSRFHRYLLFVHQGQKFYKDCCFVEDLVVTTSQDGLCLFIPISFVVDEDRE